MSCFVQYIVCEHCDHVTLDLELYIHVYNVQCNCLWPHQWSLAQARACLSYLDNGFILPEVPDNGSSTGAGGGQDMLHLHSQQQQTTM